MGGKRLGEVASREVACGGVRRPRVRFWVPLQRGGLLVAEPVLESTPRRRVREVVCAGMGGRLPLANTVESRALRRKCFADGASDERHLVIAEKRTLTPDQHGLLSTHFADQAAAQVIFSDPLRLQWDVPSGDGGTLESLLPPAQKPQVR